MALLSINWEKTFSISNTSFVSGFLIFLAVDYLVEQFVLVHYGWVILIQAKTPAICSYSWVAAAVWPIVSIIGIFFQSLRTGRYYDHREPKDPADESDENDTPRKSMNSTLRIGKTATPEGVGTKTTKSTLRQTSTTRYTGDIVPKNLTGNNALPATMHTAARFAFQDFRLLYLRGCIATVSFELEEDNFNLSAFSNFDFCNVNEALCS